MEFAVSIAAVSIAFEMERAEESARRTRNSSVQLKAARRAAIQDSRYATRVPMTKPSSNPDRNNSSSLEVGALQIAKRVASRQWTAQKVIDEHLAQIEKVNESLNAVVVSLADSAREAAAECDARLLRGEKPRPLEGVPVTIKESFHVAGTASTMGLPERRDEIQSTDGPQVAALRRAGAIVVGKTNVPQLMMWHETDNPLYGKTTHPSDPTRTCGGSSGGEAAIIAAGGSPLGLASDLGGSIRIPAHFCGCVGLMPTPGSITSDGAARNFSNVRMLEVTAGFIARRVEDLTVPTSILLNQCPATRADSREKLVPRLLEPTAVAGMHIGVLKDDGYFPAVPAVQRAVAEAGQRLLAAGATLVDFRPVESTEELIRVYFGLMGADGNTELRGLARGNRLDWRVRRMLRYGRLPIRLRPTLAAIMRRTQRRRLASLLLATGKKTDAQLQQLVDRCQTLRAEAVTRMRNAGIDAMISPPHALAAFPHGLGVDLLPAASYAFAMNLLGWPAGVVPITRVDTAEEEISGAKNPLERLAYRSQRGSSGMPIGVQVSAGENREDVVLSVMTVLEANAPE